MIVPFCASVGASADEQLIVAGLPLDAPFAVERCPYGRKTATEKRTSACWVASLGDEKQQNPEFREILWPGKYNPGPFGFQTTVIVKDGKLTAISFRTTGFKFQEVELKELIQKFGNPTTLQTFPMQNVFGAKFDKIKATWNTEYYVEFESFEDKIDEGSVFIQSEAEHQRDLERVNKYRTAHPTNSGL